MPRKTEKNPYDEHVIVARTTFIKAQKMKLIASKQNRSINGMINDWIDRTIRKWDRIENDEN